MDADFLLMRKMKNGDEDALEEFVRKYYPDIYRFCLRNLNGSSEAEDLTQMTFERFFRNFFSYCHQGKAKNYLYVIARNLLKDHAKQKRPIPMEELAEKGTDACARIEERLDLDAALLRIPEEFREILVLYYFQELKLREIGEVLGIGLPLVKFRMKKARELLKKELEKGE